MALNDQTDIRSVHSLPTNTTSEPATKEQIQWTPPPQNTSNIPLLGGLSEKSRNLFIAWIGEYIGTTMYLFFAFAGTMVAHVAKNDGTGADIASLLFVALSFGFSLAINIWVFFRVSGGLFNPAVTFAFWIIGGLDSVKAGTLFLAQMLGGMTAAGLVQCMFPGPLSVTTTLGGGTSTAQGLFIEMFLTAELVFAIFMLAAEKHRATFLAPIGIGLVFFVIELVGVYFTGGSVNPARSFGPCVANREFPNIHWIYWVGPLLGAAIASGLYKFMKMVQYETANPGQDADHYCQENPCLPACSARRCRDLEAQAAACKM